MRITSVLARSDVAKVRSGTILVVDEDPGARAALRELFHSAGYDVREAASGAEALAATRAALPDAVLLDVALPGTTGFDVCRTMREEFGEELPIILVSATRTEPLDRVAGLLIGADDYVASPFAHAELIARVRRSLARVRFLRRDGRSGPLTAA